jgi:hypothetical protein
MENGNQPAYSSQSDDMYYHGVSKREYFAGLALQGFVNNYHSDCEYCAKMSVKMADALLAELERTKSE